MIFNAEARDNARVYQAANMTVTVHEAPEQVSPFHLELRDAAARLADSVGGATNAESERRRLSDPFALGVCWHTAEEGGTGRRPDPDRYAGRNPVGLPDARLDNNGPDNNGLDGRLDDLGRVYERVASKRLVVLGKPGSGKSVLAMHFVLDRLKGRGNTGPVPVVFRLGLWDPSKKSLRNWLLDQLLFEIPSLGAPIAGGSNLAAVLFDGGWILPVLDGLDEIVPEQRHKALRELNATHMPLLLTSQPDQYNAAVAAVGVLTRAAVIVLDDLTLDDLAGYLPPTAPGRHPVSGNRSWPACGNSRRNGSARWCVRGYPPR